MYRVGLLAAVSSGALLGMVATGHAQDARGSATLEEITVTAERVETKLQRSAVAVTAISGNDLLRSSVTTVTDLAKKVPGLEIASAGTLAQVYIRGVGAKCSQLLYRDGRRLQCRPGLSRARHRAGRQFLRPRTSRSREGSARQRCTDATPPAAPSTWSARSRCWAKSAATPRSKSATMPRSNSTAR